MSCSVNAPVASQLQSSCSCPASPQASDSSFHLKTGKGSVFPYHLLTRVILDHLDGEGMVHAEAFSHLVFLPGGTGMGNIILCGYLPHRISILCCPGNAGLGLGNSPLVNIFPQEKCKMLLFSPLRKSRIFCLKFSFYKVEVLHFWLGSPRQENGCFFKHFYSRSIYYSDTLN